MSTHLRFLVKCCFLFSRQNGLSSTHPLPLVGETPSGVVGESPLRHPWNTATGCETTWHFLEIIEGHKFQTVAVTNSNAHQKKQKNLSVTWHLGTKVSSSSHPRLQSNRGVDHLQQSMAIHHRISWHIIMIRHDSSWFIINSSSQLAFSLLIFLVQRPYLASRGLSC